MTDLDSGPVHSVPLADWLLLGAVDRKPAVAGHWYILQNPSRVDIKRNAVRQTVVTGNSQIIHEHDNRSRCNSQCSVLVPGLAPEATS